MQLYLKFNIFFSVHRENFKFYLLPYTYYYRCLQLLAGFVKH